MKPCRKRAFETEERARRFHAFASFRVRPYLCPHCGLWHVTNSDKKDHGRPPLKPSRKRRECQRSLERPEVTDPAIVAALFARRKEKSNEAYERIGGEEEGKASILGQEDGQAEGE